MQQKATNYSKNVQKTSTIRPEYIKTGKARAHYLALLIFLELIAQGAHGDVEHSGGLGFVVATGLERDEDECASNCGISKPSNVLTGRNMMGFIHPTVAGILLIIAPRYAKSKSKLDINLGNDIVYYISMYIS